MNRITLKPDRLWAGEAEPGHLSQGIPFADKVLGRGTPVCVVDGTGRRLPTQAEPLAFWRSDKEFVKWLLLDVEVPNDRDDELFLEYGEGVTTPPPAFPVATEAGDSRLIIANGRLRVTMPTEGSGFVESLEVMTDEGWRDLLADGTGPCLYMVDGNGVRYDTRTPAPASKMSVEEEGPVRAAVKIEGFHAGPDGERFCPYVLRFHVFSGSKQLKVNHTFVFDQDPDRVVLEGIGMEWPVKLGGNLRAAVGGDEKSHWAERWRTMRYLQVSDDRYEIVRDGVPFGSGGRGPGWACESGDRGSAAVALRDGWREHPKGIVLRPNGMDIGLWPIDYDKPLDLVNPWKEKVIRPKTEEELHRKLEAYPTAGVGMKGFLGKAGLPMDSSEGNMESAREALELEEKYLDDRLVAYGDTGTDNAMGLAKTHEFWLRFSDVRLSDRTVDTWAGAMQIPSIAPPEPAYVCGTNALRLLSPADPERFPEIERQLENIFDSLLAGPVEEHRLYGAIDYGDLVNPHARWHGLIYRLIKDDPERKITDLVGWFNDESEDLGLTLWDLYARTGERKYWKIADAYSRHRRDVDVIHDHPLAPERNGWMHYHNMLHWSGSPSPSHTNINGQLLHYYLTGDRRTFDVCRESADAALRKQEPCGVFSCRGLGLRRELTHPMQMLWAFYEATWEERYGDSARKTLELYLNAQDASGQWPVGIATAGDRGEDVVTTENIGFGAGGLEALAMYDAWRLTGDRRIVEAIRKVADWILRNDTPLFGTMPNKGVFVAYAYRMTKDEKLRQAIEENLTTKINFAQHRTGLAHAWGEKTTYVDHFIDTHPDVSLDFYLWEYMQEVASMTEIGRVAFQRAMDLPRDVTALLAAESLLER